MNRGYMAIIVIVILALVLFSFHGKDKMDSGVVSVADRADDAVVNVVDDKKAMPAAAPVEAVPVKVDDKKVDVATTPVEAVPTPAEAVPAPVDEKKVDPVVTDVKPVHVPAPEQTEVKESGDHGDESSELDLLTLNALMKQVFVRLLHCCIWSA